MFTLLEFPYPQKYIEFKVTTWQIKCYVCEYREQGTNSVTKCMCSNQVECLCRYFSQSKSKFTVMLYEKCCFLEVFFVDKLWCFFSTFDFWDATHDSIMFFRFVYLLDCCFFVRSFLFVFEGSFSLSFLHCCIIVLYGNIDLTLLNK